jgi:hypothetical protein
VGDRLSVSGSHASCEVVCWWFCCGGLVGGDGDVVICLNCRLVSRCCKCPCRVRLGVRLLRGGLLMGMRCVGGFVVGRLGYELLVLLEA